MAATIAAIRKLDADEVFRYMDDSAFVNFNFNGYIQDNYDSTRVMIKKAYSQIKTLDANFSEEKCTVLSRDIVLYTAKVNEKLVDLNNKEQYNQGTVTVVLHKRNGKWLGIHCNQTIYPIQKQ